MELNPLAAALQGIGYARLLTALQGLWAVTIIPNPLPLRFKLPPVIITPRRRSGRRRVITPREWPREPIEDDEDEELLLLMLA